MTRIPTNNEIIGLYLLEVIGAECVIVLNVPKYFPLCVFEIYLIGIVIAVIRQDAYFTLPCLNDRRRGDVLFQECAYLLWASILVEEVSFYLVADREAKYTCHNKYQCRAKNYHLMCFFYTIKSRR